MKLTSIAPWVLVAGLGVGLVAEHRSPTIVQTRPAVETTTLITTPLNDTPTSSGPSAYQLHEMQREIDQAQQTADEAKRIENFQQIEQMVHPPTTTK